MNSLRLARHSPLSVKTTTTATITVEFLERLLAFFRSRKAAPAAANDQLDVDDADVYGGDSDDEAMNNFNCCCNSGGDD